MIRGSISPRIDSYHSSWITEPINLFEFSIIALNWPGKIVNKNYTAMKTILVATDFSKAAHNACLYAAELAHAFNTRLIVFNAYQRLPVTAPEAAVILSAGDMKAIAQKQLGEEASHINLWNTIDVDTLYAEGAPAHTILTVARENKVDLIVVGMKEQGKGLRKVLGSTATDLVRKSTIPVIIVPENALFTRPDTIALANESDLNPDDDVHLLDALREIMERFEPKLYFIRISKNQFKEAFDVLNPPTSLTRTMKSFAPVYKCIEGKDISQSLNDFIRTYHINMLAMLPHKLSLLEALFTRSATRSMVFEASIPLLILPGLHK